ncbi:MAG: hypothetical protein CMH57_08950 [Myxococcales bacterium]|nr:hypothetical protein [Myxococcales bacterium]
MLDDIAFQRVYAPYLKRVRLMLQRYVLALEFIEGTTSSPEMNVDGVAQRSLFGLSMSDERQQAIDHINAELRRPYEELVTEGVDSRFEQVRWEFRLSETACDVLWMLLAGHLVPETLWLYRALWGDTDRSLVDRVFLFHVLDPFAERLRSLYDVFESTSAIFAHRLVVELRAGNHEEADGLLAPSRRLIRHLVGVQSGLPNVPGLVAIPPPSAEDAWRAEMALSDTMLRRLRFGFSGKRRFLLIGADNTGPDRLARRVMSDQGAPLIEASVPGLLRGGEDALVLLLGEAKLRRAGVFLDQIEALDRDDASPTFTRRLMELMATVRLPIFFRATYGLSADLRLQLAEKLEAVELRLQLPDSEARQELWSRVLADHFPEEVAADVAFVARAYPFGMGEIERALALARLQARERDLRDPTLKPSDVEAGCNTLSGQNMSALAQRVKVHTVWDDVVLSETTEGVIQEMLTYGRFQRQVFEDQGYGTKISYGRGLTALFWGPPGTGKTMVSGLLARELGLELYRIELSQVVSKYIGETEQRLAQIFDEALVSGMALLFDEADALFAKRTEVKSSVDRYANLEVNFLLQRIEHHDGMVILTTNFPKSIDEAFMRRIRFKAEFPAPGQEEREQLWQRMIPASAPRSDSIRFDALAKVYELTGGEIRNAVLRAAFYAAEEGAPLGTKHLDRAAQVEYREAGRLVRATALKQATRGKSP